MDVVASEPGKRPLQLRLASTPAPASAPARSRPSNRPARFRVAPPNLRQRAVEALLADADEEASRLQSPAADGTFRFQRRGDAGRQIAQGYNTLCDTVSRKVWDEPNGKRVTFDVAGKPGVGVEIPLR